MRDGRAKGATLTSRVLRSIAIPVLLVVAMALLILSFPWLDGSAFAVMEYADAQRRGEPIAPSYRDEETARGDRLLRRSSFVLYYQADSNGAPWEDRGSTCFTGWARTPNGWEHVSVMLERQVGEWSIVRVSTSSTLTCTPSGP